MVADPSAGTMYLYAAAVLVDGPVPPGRAVPYLLKMVG